MWKSCRVAINDSIKKTMQVIDESALQIALVVDYQDKLLGIVTDGDIRRAILQGRDLAEHVGKIMTVQPVVIDEGYNRREIISWMQNKALTEIPVVNKEGVVVDLLSLAELLYRPRRENPVVLMVGGLGSRLRPLTNDCPKPLLKVGNKPILEIILENFIEAGFRKFYFAVNYKADMIEKHFGEGSQYGVRIQYLYEKKRMGTAGALSLLPEQPNQPVIVMNGDLLTKVNFEQLLQHHAEEAAWATMAVREYNYQIPYGVIRIDENKIIDIQEKPIRSYFVNAGIYVLNPEVVLRIRKEEFLDMTDLFCELIEEEKNTAAFPIREYWLDIGKMDDFEKAQKEYVKIF